jgi:hypothetical protein
LRYRYEKQKKTPFAAADLSIMQNGVFMKNAGMEA